ncbi:hypothetical protein P3L10_021691 [Capsicum annuum]
MPTLDNQQEEKEDGANKLMFFFVVISRETHVRMIGSGCSDRWHDEGYYIAKFNNSQNRDEILYSGPYTMNGMPLYLKVWSPKFDFQQEMPTTLPLWEDMVGKIAGRPPDRRKNLHYEMANMELIYGSNSLEKRKDMWQGLHRIGALIDVPWCIYRDFNSPLTSADRVGGQSTVKAETKEFQETVDMMKLVDMKAYERRYSWMNKHMWFKIDRAICNEE